MPQVDFAIQDMDTLGLALIVCGAAFLCSGLIFLLPSERRADSFAKSCANNLNEIKSHLNEMREQHHEY